MTPEENHQKAISEALAFSLPFLGVGSAFIIVVGVCVLVKQSLDAKKAGMTFRRSRPRQRATRQAERRPSTSHHLTVPPTPHLEETARPPMPYNLAIVPYLAPPPYSEVGRPYEKPPDYSEIEPQ